MTHPPTGELRALTGARGIAAWLVVLFHIRRSIGGLPAIPGAIIDKGYLAVDFFFLLSGFVIWLSWSARLHDEGRRAVVPFLRKRIARIWPLHAAMLAATVALALLLRTTGRSDPAAFPFGDLPLHILLLQDWGFTRDLAWNVPSWSISAELGAYLVFPLVAIVIDWRDLSTAALLGIAGMILLVLYLSFGPSQSLGTDIARFGLVRCICEFMTGTFVCAMWRRGANVGIAAVVAAFIAGLWAIGMRETIAVPALFATLLLVLASTSRPANPLGRAVPHYIGTISYATYLCHYPLWIGFKLVFVRDVDAVPAVSIAGYLLLVLGCSAVLYRYLERPAQRVIDDLGRRPGGWARALPRPPAGSDARHR